jgi:hypothetical protein
MGFFFTILYLITAYLAPQTIFGDLAQYHVEIVIVVLALIFSLPGAGESGVMGLTQSWAIVGLCGAVAGSMIFNHWLGGAPIALLEFVPEVMAFFLIVMNCKKKWHLQVLALTLFGAAVFIIYQGQMSILDGKHFTYYILTQLVNEELGTIVIRIRGLSFLGDPNDFAQFLVSLIPIMFLFWKKGESFKNFLLCYLPAGILFYGMYLCHSRGSMVALMAVCIVAGRKKIGIFPAVVIGVGLFLALSVAGFSGGRDVSAGEDRLSAWGTGLMLIRRHPFFGVGFQRFSDFNEITAHNTFVVCAAELGLIGVYCWVMMMFVTIRNAWEGSKDPDQEAKDRQKKLDKIHAKQPFLQGVASITDATLAPAGATGGVAMLGGSQQFSGGPMPFSLPAESMAGGGGFGPPNPFEVEETPEEKQAADDEVRRMSTLMVISFAGFLTAGWFLSRAYTMCLYVNAGIGAAIYKMARDRGIVPPPLPTGLVAKYTFWTVAALLVIVETMVRVDHFLPK